MELEEAAALPVSEELPVLSASLAVSWRNQRRPHVIADDEWQVHLENEDMQ